MKAIRVWYAVDRDGEGYFYTGAPYRDVDSEMWNCDGEAYSVTSELFNGVENDTPIEFEMKYEIAEKS